MDGIIAVQIDEDEWEPQLCQFCQQRKELFDLDNADVYECRDKIHALLKEYNCKIELNDLDDESCKDIILVDQDSNKYEEF